MKRPAQVLIGLGLFFMAFFVVVRYIDDSYWWAIPAVMFTGVINYGVRRLDQINRRVIREKPDEWLAAVMAAAPSTPGVPMPTAPPPNFQAYYENDADYEPPYDDEEEPYDGSGMESVRQRRFLDDFLVADEADLGPHELHLKGLDKYVFTSRHAYLVHDRGEGADPTGGPQHCDVATIFPGMSIADLIEAAQQHRRQCETVYPEAPAR
jgi:hypothetical protein